MSYAFEQLLPAWRVPQMVTFRSSSGVFPELGESLLIPDHHPWVQFRVTAGLMPNSMGEDTVPSA